jgi:hypothetical protein
LQVEGFVPKMIDAAQPSGFIIYRFRVLDSHLNKHAFFVQYSKVGERSTFSVKL